MNNTTLPITDIKVGNRHRKVMGDLSGLAQSIEEIGLLHPIVVDDEKNLICGQRRLQACKLLKWDDIPVRVINLQNRVRAEFDENELRKDFTPEELVEIGESLEEREKESAKERQKDHGGTAPGVARNTSEKFSEVKGEALNKVASAVGMSRPTYEKAKEVVHAAREEPEQFADLVEQMNATGKVDPAFQEMKARKSPKPEPEHPHSDRLERWLHFVVSQTLIIDVELRGITALLSEKNKWDPRQVREYILPQIDNTIRTLQRYEKEIRDAFDCHG
jgi:ParB-like chromosome segregation protein Spo0J